ncbi:MAG: tetratricopeptide repeat protein [Deltaproteobacteria bacterium]|nr:tetratricopeptide repeat protein [Deltaproteobacteria bacterium]
MNRKAIIDEIAQNKTLKRWEIRDLNLSEVDFSGVDCTGTAFAGCAMREARFAGAVLAETRFSDCHLDRAVFRGASLRGAVFDGCRGLTAENVNFLRDQGATVTEPSRSPLTYAMVAVAIMAALVVGYLMIGAEPDPGMPAPEAEPTSGAEAPKDLSALLTEGIEALAARDYGNALPSLERAVSIAPDNTEAQYQLARCLLEMERYDDAREHFEIVLSKNPAMNEDVAVRQFIAETYQRTGRAADADKVYHAVEEKYAGNAAIVYGLVLNHAHLRWKTKDYDGAHELLDRLLKIGERDQHSGVHLVKGLVYKDEGKRDLAREAFRTAERTAEGNLRPQYDAQVQLAIMDIEDGHEETALAELKRALAKGADDGQVFNAFFQVYAEEFGQGGWDKASPLLDSMQRMFDEKPRYLATLHVEYGKRAMDRGMLDEAKRHFERVQELSKDPAQLAWAAESIEEILRTQAPAPLQ